MIFRGDKGGGATGAIIVAFVALLEIRGEASVVFIWVGEALNAVHAMHLILISLYPTLLYGASKGILLSLYFVMACHPKLFERRMGWITGLEPATP